MSWKEEVIASILGPFIKGCLDAIYNHDPVGLCKKLKTYYSNYPRKDLIQQVLITKISHGYTQDSIMAFLKINQAELLNEYKRCPNAGTMELIDNWEKVYTALKPFAEGGI